MQDYRARQRKKLQELERLAVRHPADWKDKTIRWRIVDTELLSEDYLSNKQLAARLDASKILKCPYAETWLAAATDSGNRGFILFIGKIRKWVNKPGKEGGGPTRVSIL
jgi:hypothetical protein